MPFRTPGGTKSADSTDNTLRIERVNFRHVGDINNRANTPFVANMLTQNTFSVERGAGTTELFSRINDHVSEFTVKAGVYDLTSYMVVNPSAAGGTVHWEIRKASDNSILATSTRSAIEDGGNERITSQALLLLDSDTLIDVYVFRLGQASAIVENWHIDFRVLQSGGSNIDSASFADDTLTLERLRSTDIEVDLSDLANEYRGRRHICVFGRKSSEPTAFSWSNASFDGSVVADFTSDGVDWVNAGESVPSGTDTLYFVFGEVVYSAAREEWEFEDSVILIDSTSTAWDIEYAPDWTGPWHQNAFNAAIDHFAQIRTRPGVNIIRKIGTDVVGDRVEWVMMSEDIRQPGQRNDNFDEPTLFDFFPDEYTWILFEWHWRGSSDRCFAGMRAEQIQTMSRNSGAGNGTFLVRCSKRDGMTISRSGEEPASSHTDHQEVRVHFEAEDTNVASAIRYMRMFDWARTGADGDGTFRAWVLP